MPQKITNENGEEIEVFTNEELESQKQAALEEYKTSNPDKTSEIEALQVELAETKEKLEGLSNKDLNFAALRDKVKEKERQIDGLTKSIDEKIGVAKKEILEGVMKDHYNDTINRLVGDDKELLAKVELQYKRLADSASTKEEVTRKLSDAFVLATGSSKESFNSGAFSSGEIGKIKVGSNKNKLSDEEKEFAKKMAGSVGMKLEDKDFEK